MAPLDDRRSFLRWATHGLSALFAAILGVPALAYLIDPRNRRGASSELRLVDGVRLTEVFQEQRPKPGVIRDMRIDGWTLHPDDVVGRVWVVYDRDAPRQYRVFTTICPHLGCSVSLAEECFACPCHNARFDIHGERLLPSPALRGMDELDWEHDPEDRDRILVRYQSFQAGTADKKAIV